MLVSAKYKFVTRQQYVEHSIHLFRALLREATYLPDQSSRIFFRKYIRWRFQNAAKRGTILLRQAEGKSRSHQEHVTDAKDAKNTENAKIAENAKEELTQALKKGHKGLSQLIRANEGELKPLIRVLRHTYGRNGPRRYELMRPLLTPDVDLSSASKPAPPPSSTAPASRFAHVSVPAMLNSEPTVTRQNIIYTLSRQYSKLRALTTSQLTTNIDSHRQRIRTQISVPALNTWCRPMPLKRVKNLLAQKWARFLTSIMPPLPEHEWLQLKGLATGTIPWPGCPQRRKWPNGVAQKRLTAVDLEKLAHLSDAMGELVYLDSAVSSGDPDASKRDKILELASSGPTRRYWSANDTWLSSAPAIDDALEAVLEDEMLIAPLNKKLAGRERGHTITSRFMRRMYMKIFKTCPVLLPDGAAGSPHAWKVVWGARPEMHRSPGLESEAALREAFFPEGKAIPIRIGRRERWRWSAREDDMS